MKVVLRKYHWDRSDSDWLWILHIGRRRLAADRFFRTREAAWNDLRTILNAKNLEIETVQ